MAEVSWPDGRDAGRRVQLLQKDGSSKEGVLFLNDVWFDGENEVPIFRVRLDDGTDISFADHEAWSFA